MSIAQSVLDIVREEMAKNNATMLRSVRLNVGQMSAIVPESLSFCFEIITSGTELEGAKLIMDVTPITGYCHRCDRDFAIKEYDFSCPACGDTNIETVSGQDLTVAEIEVE